MKVRTTAAAGMWVLAAASAAQAADEPLPPVQAVAVGDFDGDGKLDFAVGLPELNVGKFKKAGEVRFYSGATGAFVRKLGGVCAEQAYGDALAPVGDVDGDGATDLAVAAPFGDGDPYVDVVSGKTGSTIATKRPERAGMIQWGNALCPLGDGSGKTRVELLIRCVQQKTWRLYFTDEKGMGCSFADDGAYFSRAFPAGDLDGDGKPDVADCNWAADVDGKKGAGLVRVLSGDMLIRGGPTVLLTLKGPHAGARMGLAVAPAGDWNGDGKSDLLATTGAADDRKSSWTVRVHSGKDGAELWKAAGAAGDLHVPGVAVVGDADGDGKPDVAVATPWIASAAGAVSVLAAKDSAVVWTVKGAAKESFGDEVRAFADADGDGVADLLVVSPGAAVGVRKGNGYLRVLSGKTGATLLLVNPLATR